MTRFPQNRTTGQHAEATEKQGFQKPESTAKPGETAVETAYTQTAAHGSGGKGSAQHLRRSRPHTMNASAPQAIEKHSPLAKAAAYFAVAAAIVFAAFAPQSAFADGAGDLQNLVEQTAAEYNEAADKVAELENQIEQNKQSIAEIEDTLPQIQEAAAQSARTLYKLGGGSTFAIEMLLSSNTTGEFLSSFDYLDAINTHNASTIDKLSARKSELDLLEDQLESDLKDAEEAAQKAEDALTKAKEARQKAEEEAIERARRQSEREAELAEAERKAKQGQNASGVDAANGSSTTAQANGVEALSAGVTGNDIDWSADKRAFVSEWTSRIDAYLTGSPLAGQGSVFASAAWDNGVDPRWSPAISCVESTKGAYCFLPCNAWGWGDYSFESWEEAIAGHVAYLGQMYGSTVTPEAASIYCPPNASFWYNRCVEEMASI